MCQAKCDYRMLWFQLSGVKSGSGSSKGVTVPGGLIVPRERKIEEIRESYTLNSDEPSGSRIEGISSSCSFFFALAPRHVAVEAIVTHHLLAFVWDMGAHGGNPFQ